MRDPLTDSEFWVAFVLGVTLGAAGALMYAPTSGQVLRERVRSHLRARRDGWTDYDDHVVTDQSEQSFPASDAPSWSPITSSGGVS